ncbi:uncharacterized protein [Branchiostoma lanceolatum]|uniref:uncharacterized protein n=1 Tax=Branchiostoma lanceolatum TaxID=7740 RepID=UPI0034555046
MAALFSHQHNKAYVSSVAMDVRDKGGPNGGKLLTTGTEAPHLTYVRRDPCCSTGGVTSEPTISTGSTSTEKVNLKMTVSWPCIIHYDRTQLGARRYFWITVQVLWEGVSPD